MKIVLKGLFPVIAMFFLVQPLYAIDVEGTNQFFASKTSAGLTVYVFIYPDKFVFVSGKDKPADKVTLNFNMKTSGATDIFIAGNMFCMKQRNILYGYDLTEILNKRNDNTRLPATAIKIEINGIDRIVGIADDVIYTKSGDRNVYRYTPKTGKYDEPIGIQASSSPFYVAHNPILERRKTEYASSKAAVVRLVNRYAGIDAKRISAIVDHASNSTPIAALSSSVEKELSKDYGFDAAAFSDFFVLAAVAGAASDIQGVLAPLNKAPTPPARGVVDAYYKARETYSQLSLPTALQGRQNRINEYYNGEVRKLINNLAVYGDYEAKYNKFSSIMTKLRTDDYNWMPDNNNKLNEFTTNYGKIQNYDTLLSSVPNQLNGDREYTSARKIFSFFLEGYKQKNIDLNAKTVASKDLLSLMIDFGTRIVGAQRKSVTAHLDKEIGVRSGGWEVFFKAYTDFKEKQLKFEEERQKALATAEQDLKKEREAALRQRDNNLDVITNYLLNNYIASLYSQAKKAQNDSSLAGYTIANSDYNIASASEFQIQGFKISGVSVKFGDFESEIINPDKKPCFVRPATFPFIGVTSNAVYVLASRNSVAAFDLGNPRIAASPPLAVPEGVYYFVNSDQNQYMVTNDGVLHRLSVSGGSIKKERVGSALAKSSILITTIGSRDSVYVISEDGSVSDENGRSQTNVTIKSTNSKDIFTITARNGTFSIL
ncbi:MAG: hypothetical protein LBL45_12190 [Treponema sp.]|jgi:hypothetical protein|nr:hypothetical protein [Treponema sp.]